MPLVYASAFIDDFLNLAINRCYEDFHVPAYVAYELKIKTSKHL